MIKQPTLYRDRIVIPEARRMLKSMELHTSGGFPDETHALQLLCARGENDLELAVVKFLMELFGYPPSHAKEARFDKTKRALTKRNGKPPRGGVGVEA
jgi:hypothetical protein